MKFDEGYELAKFAKPCPFCGNKMIQTMSQDRYNKLHFHESGYNTIECKACHVVIRNCTMKDSTRSESYIAVLKLWNKRVAA